MRFRTAFLSVAALFITACATIPPQPNRQCNFKIVPVEVTLPTIGPPPLQQIIADKYNAGGTPTFLLMSGGSEHGAFGAGILSGWAAKHGGLPHFELVTGVSTGAILASPAFAGDSEFSASRYANVWERELLRPYAKKKNGDIALSSFPSVLRHGAVADLAPMRKLLAEYLVEMNGFQKIAAKAQHGALLVGVVDVDSGKMVALDMTDMADRIVNPRAGDLPVAQLQECYYDAVQASASAPLAATPVFIDNRMYADGGMRFSLFGEKMMEILGDLKSINPSLPAPNLYLIVNGDQETEVWCPRGKGDPRDCGVIANPEAGSAAKPPNWGLLPLGLRAVDILQNQVSRFSVHSLDVENKALFGLGATNLRYLRIELPGNKDGVEAGADHVFPRPPNPSGKSCAQWRAGDVARDQPLQFHHDYMACIVDYGKARVAADPRW